MTIAPQLPNIIRAALFVDFDNIYLGLRKMDPKAAEEFATNPSRWASWFEQGMPSHEMDDSINLKQRALLLRRCYLNPGSFSNYRAYFTRSAFSVVDCPPLTQQGKNSTDIHMVMDILDSLKHETHFDEFIILSGDADFTPVLLRLRVYDRRTVILTTGPIAQSYKAASDYVVSGVQFMEDALGILPDVIPTGVGVGTFGFDINANDEQVLNTMAKKVYEAVVAEGRVLALSLPPIFKEFTRFRNSNDWLGFNSLRDLTLELTRRKPEMCIIEGDPSWGVGLKVASFPGKQGAISLSVESVPAAVSTSGNDDLKEKIIAHVKQLVAKSIEPVNMAAAASAAIKSIGPEVITTQWAGAGSFKELLLTVNGLGFDIITAPDQPGLLYDSSRHTLPSLNLSAEKLSGLPADLAAFAQRINRVTGTPLLTPAEYMLVFTVLEEELHHHSYFLTSTSKAVRDRCIERGSPISRKAVNFILLGITYTGHVFEENPLSDTAANFAKIFKENVLGLCKNALLELSIDERKLLDDWILEGNADNLQMDNRQQ